MMQNQEESETFQQVNIENKLINHFKSKQHLKTIQSYICTWQMNMHIRKIHLVALLRPFNIYTYIAKPSNLEV